jgi:hypothetical protein
LTEVCNYSNNFVVTNRQYDKKKVIDFIGVLLYVLGVERVN